MKRAKSFGFDYYLSKKMIRDYQKKPPELRLKWLYMGNLLRMNCPEITRRLHNRFRKGEMDG